MKVMYYVNYFTTALEIVSAVLLALEIIFIVTACRKTRKCSFFKCFIFYGCFGLLCWVIMFQLLRSIGSSSLAYLSLNVFLSGFSLHGYLLSSMLLSLNRFSCIVFPVSFANRWTDKKCLIYMAVILCVTFASVCFRIGAPIEVSWLEEVSAWRFIGYHRTTHTISLICTLSICCFVTFASLVLNTWTFISWRRYRNSVSKAVYRTQRNMFIFSMISFVFSSCICLQQFISNTVLLAGYMELAAVLVDVYFPLTSVAILIDPYSIIILSPGLRKEVAALVRRARGSDAVDVIGTSQKSLEAANHKKQNDRRQALYNEE